MPPPPPLVPPPPPPLPARAQVLGSADYRSDLLRLGPSMGMSLLFITARPLPIAELQE